MPVRRVSKNRLRVRLDDPGRRIELGNIVGGPSVALDATGEIDGPKWQHVATVGEFKGYAGGDLPFAFTTEVFTQLVSNFRSHPSFAMGSDGVGTVGIVQWDFHHASEAPPDVVAQSGAPAQGWVLDLRVQTGPNGSELWALTEWLDLAKQYIKNKQYKWASVAVALDAVDPLTGNQIGAVLTSIAITNQPFIEGMNELAAERDGHAPPAPSDRQRPTGRRIRAEYYYQANSIDEAKSAIRRCFGLPLTATPAEIAKGLVALLSIVSGGEDAQEQTGIDADDLLGGIRTILGLPLLTPLVDVAQEALSLFDTEEIQTSGETENAPGDGESIPGATMTAKPKTVITASRKEEPMDPQLLNAIAKKLGVQATPEAVTAAVEGLTEIRSGLIAGLSLDKHISSERLAEAAKDVKVISARNVALTGALLFIAGTGVQLAATEAKRTKKLRLESEEMEDTTDDGRPMPSKGDALVSRLGALFKAGGVEDPDRAVGQIVKTLTDAATLEETMPELEALRSYTKAAKAEAETSAVAAARRHYYGDDESQDDVLLAFYRSKGAKVFATKYPLPSEDADGLEEVQAAEPNLSRSRVETPAAPRAAAPAVQGQGAIAASRRAPRELPAGIVNLDEYPGVNPSEQAINATKATVPGADKWSYDALCAHAFDARRRGTMISLTAGR